jgi:hypothetical protein
MSWVCWPAIVADFCAIASKLDHALGAVVAGFAQRLQLTEPEGAMITVVWDDVIDDGCGSWHASRLAHRAPWLRSKLSHATFQPAIGLVPLVPRRWLPARLIRHAVA